MKFGRIYSMFIQGREADHTVQFPLTCRFRIDNNSTFTMGKGTFQIYNLTQDVRNDLYKDAYEQATYKQIVFSAGYQNEPSVPIIFKGNVLSAFSFRQGPDWITQIEALDGGFAIDNGSINLTKPAPYEYADVLSDAVNAMPRVKLGLIGAFDFPRPSCGITFCGSPWDLITRTVLPLQGQVFINNEQVYILQQWEYIEDTGTLDTISAETGIIGTPQSQDGLVRVRMLFEPRLVVGQLIELKTPSIPVVILRNGFFKILSISHAGTVSGAVCEDLITNVTMYQPDRTLEAA